MTQDRWNRVLRTAFQAAVPALLLFVASLTDALPGVLEGSALTLATAVLTVAASYLQNLRDAKKALPDGD